MEAYTGFAYIYDEYMDNIPYEEWFEYLHKLLIREGVEEESTVAELGCGTGTVTRMLDRAGYSCIGIDLSEDMLAIASDKTYESNQEIIYSLQDMREFELPYEADACVSIGDSMNYINSVEDITEVFKCVKNSLRPGGSFIFDLKTIHFFRDVVSDNTYAESRDESALIWENEYDAETRNNLYGVTFFVENEDGLFERYEENHYQHGFTIDEITGSAESAGLTVVNVYDAFTFNEPDDDSERLYFVMRKEQI